MYVGTFIRNLPDLQNCKPALCNTLKTVSTACVRVSASQWKDWQVKAKSELQLMLLCQTTICQNLRNFQRGTHQLIFHVDQLPGEGKINHIWHLQKLRHLRVISENYEVVLCSDWKDAWAAYWVAIHQSDCGDTLALGWVRKYLLLRIVKSSCRS